MTGVQTCALPIYGSGRGAAAGVAWTDVRLSERQFLRLAWVTLGYAIAVIIWGAVVRATSSGAGCGAHWPLCNGDVVPLAPRVQTVIEFAHRTTSGLILLLTAALVWAARSSYPAGHAARRAAGWSMVFVLIEAALVGGDRKSTRLNSSHMSESRMPSSA